MTKTKAAHAESISSDSESSRKKRIPRKAARAGRLLAVMAAGRRRPPLAFPGAAPDGRAGRLLAVRPDPAEGVSELLQRRAAKAARVLDRMVREAAEPAEPQTATTTAEPAEPAVEPDPEADDDEEDTQRF